MSQPITLRYQAKHGHSLCGSDAQALEGLLAQNERDLEQLRGFLQFFVEDAFKVAKTSYGPSEYWMNYWQQTWPKEYEVAVKARAALDNLNNRPKP